MQLGITLGTRLKVVLLKSGGFDLKQNATARKKIVVRTTSIAEKRIRNIRI